MVTQSAVPSRVGVRVRTESVKPDAQPADPALPSQPATLTRVRARVRRGKDACARANLNLPRRSDRDSFALPGRPYAYAGVRGKGACVRVVAPDQFVYAPG